MIGWLFCKLGVHDNEPRVAGIRRCVRCGKFS